MCMLYVCVHVCVCVCVCVCVVCVCSVFFQFSYDDRYEVPIISANDPDWIVVPVYHREH